MRRRALLAASMPSGGDGGIDFGELPPESTEFAFPLYLNITEFSYDYGDELEYFREGDEISDLLRGWFLDNCKKDNDGYSLELTKNCQIYINGSPIATLSMLTFESEIRLNPIPSPFSLVTLTEGGWLWGFINK